MRPQDLLPIGTLAARTGVSVSALRFYESKGLLAPLRNAGGQRRFARADIRRVSFILIAQQLGLSVAAIRQALDRLPQARTPSAADWRRISADIRVRLDAQITQLTRTRELLDGCIGCGCLSLDRCALYNPDDRAATYGPGARYLAGDPPAAADRV
ncbi:MAG: redox-sensitive transcriptional activator SoxR [Sphingomonas sp.]